MAKSNFDPQTLRTELCSSDETIAYHNELSDDSDSSSTEEGIVEHRPQRIDIPAAQIDNCSDVQMGHRLHYHAPVVINQNFLSATSQTVTNSLDDHRHQALTAQILNNTEIGNPEVDTTTGKKTPKKIELFPSINLFQRKRRAWILASVVLIANVAVTSTISLLIAGTAQTREDIMPEVSNNTSRWKTFKQFLDALQKHRNKSGDWSSLPVMVRYGDAALVEMMLNNGADPDMQDDRGCTGLHVAAELDNLKITNLLIKNGANLTVPAIYFSGQLPIHMATSSKHRNIITRLLDEGVPVDARTSLNDTSLHFAVMNDDSNTALLLIGRGACVNARNNANETALHVCAIFGYLKLASILLNKGADVNAKNVKMQTPLHFSVMENNLNMTSFLVTKGADLFARDLEDHTPFDIASPNVRDWLSSNGYRSNNNSSHGSQV